MGVERHIHVRYYAALREQRGCSEEAVRSEASNPLELYADLSAKHGLTFTKDQLRVVINDAFCDWSQALVDGDTVVFVPPVAGG